MKWLVAGTANILVCNDSALKLELGCVLSPRCTLSWGLVERKNIQQTEEKNTGTLAGTGHTEGPAWLASEGASKRRSGEGLIPLQEQRRDGIRRDRLVRCSEAWPTLQMSQHLAAGRSKSPQVRRLETLFQKGSALPQDVV